MPLLFFILCLLSPAPVFAQPCPVCTVAVGAGVGLSRYLGVDDAVSGVWFGGLIYIFARWTVHFFIQKGVKTHRLKLLIFSLAWLFSIWSLRLVNLIGDPYRKICGLDRLLFGLIAGGLAFPVGLLLDRYLRTLNRDRVYIKFQKVVLPALSLFITSFLIYLSLAG